MPLARLHAVYNSLYEKSWLTTLNPALTTPVAFCDRPVSLIASCRLTERHNVAALIDALMTLAGRGLKLHTTIVGDGSERKDLIQTVRNHDLPVEFVGQEYDRNVLRALYAQADIAVSPGAHGLNVVQGLSFGLPVIGPHNDRNSGPESEALVHGHTGLTYDISSTNGLADSIEVLAHDSNLRAKLGQQGYELALERYTAESHASKFDTIVHKVYCGHDECVAES
ncbi:glycosyltransferase family 4 protein [Pseudactinotalea sp. Z1748]|uniref:glycosyltransferase family 4 protein n=1 Tax=Pseudactinotalea sp. Z1748 TaxID=3413027 RepID=UPI003C7CCCA2